MSNQLVSLSDVERIGTIIAQSGLFGAKKPQEAIALCLIAQAFGMHPAMAAQDFDIIQGRPSKKSDAMLRTFLENGGKVEWHKLDDSIADATFSHPAGGSLRITWDMNRAKTAGLGGKDMWKKYPRQMLRARCVSEGVRSVFPAATAGTYVPEEIMDFEPQPKRTEKDMGKAEVIEQEIITHEPEVIVPFDYDAASDKMCAAKDEAELKDAFSVAWKRAKADKDDGMTAEVKCFYDACKLPIYSGSDYDYDTAGDKMCEAVDIKSLIGKFVEAYRFAKSNNEDGMADTIKAIYDEQKAKLEVPQ